MLKEYNVGQFKKKCKLKSVPTPQYRSKRPLPRSDVGPSTDNLSCTVSNKEPSYAPELVAAGAVNDEGLVVWNLNTV
jgi:hypothetical protein